MNKGPRERYSRNAEERKYDQELRENPPIVIWETIRGIRVAVYVKDPEGKPGRRPRPSDIDEEAS